MFKIWSCIWNVISSVKSTYKKLIKSSLFRNIVLTFESIWRNEPGKENKKKQVIQTMTTLPIALFCILLTCYLEHKKDTILPAHVNDVTVSQYFLQNIAITCKLSIVH